VLSRQGASWLTSTAEHCTQVQGWSWRNFGSSGGDLPELRRQGFILTEHKTGNSGDGQTNHNGSDFQEAACVGVRFHGSTVALHLPKVLIDKTWAFIDTGDARFHRSPVGRVMLWEF
jgi:hypothetical protein